MTKIGPFRNFNSNPDGNIRTRRAKQAPKNQRELSSAPHYPSHSSQSRTACIHRNWGFPAFLGCRKAAVGGAAYWAPLPHHQDEGNVPPVAWGGRRLHSLFTSATCVLPLWDLLYKPLTVGPSGVDVPSQLTTELVSAQRRHRKSYCSITSPACQHFKDKMEPGNTQGGEDIWEAGRAPP